MPDIHRLDTETDTWLDIYDVRDWLERQAIINDPWDENEQIATALLRLIEHIPNMLITEMRHILVKNVTLDNNSQSSDID